MPLQMNRDLIDKAIKSLKIQDVYLRECSIVQRKDYDPKTPTYDEAEVVFLHRPTETVVINIPIEGQEKPLSLLKAYYETVFRVMPPRDAEEMKGVDVNSFEESAAKALVDVRAKFTAEYRIDNAPLEEDAIAEFCKFNVGYHVWPYWRELAQSIGNRLRLPPIIPPLYLVPHEAQAARAPKKEAAPVEAK